MGNELSSLAQARARWHEVEQADNFQMMRATRNEVSFGDENTRRGFRSRPARRTWGAARLRHVETMQRQWMGII